MKLIGNQSFLLKFTTNCVFLLKIPQFKLKSFHSLGVDRILLIDAGLSLPKVWKFIDHYSYIQTPYFKLFCQLLQSLVELYIVYILFYDSWHKKLFICKSAPNVLNLKKKIFKF